MSDNSAIEWTEASWNPVTGCTKVSPGCDHCYAERITERFHGPGSFTEVKLHPDRLNLPLRWRKPRRVFVNSMSDLFHQDVPDEFIGSVFEVMAKTPQHTYQVLTKRHRRMLSLLRRWAGEGTRHDWAGPGTAVFRRHDMAWVGPIPWSLPNVWLGVSVEDQRWADIRIPALLDTPAAVRWLSCEPLLGSVDLRKYLRYIDWVVVGGESGPGARRMDPAWAQAIVDQCALAGVPVFVKQLGSVYGGRHHHDIDAFPPGLRVREYPELPAPAGRRPAKPQREPVSTVEEGR